jgi:hypothetical protein
MAVLNAPKEFGPELGENPPAGTYIGVCFHVQDEFDVERVDKQTGEKYTVNQTRFYFGVKAKDGKTYKVRTRPYTLSLAKAANLPKFIASWFGAPPKAGWDTQSAIGSGAQLTIVHNSASNGKVYADISSISPVMDELQSRIPAVALFGATQTKQDNDETPF